MLKYLLRLLKADPTLGFALIRLLFWASKSKRIWYNCYTITSSSRNVHLDHFHLPSGIPRCNGAGSTAAGERTVASFQQTATHRRPAG